MKGLLETYKPDILQHFDFILLNRFKRGIPLSFLGLVSIHFRNIIDFIINSSSLIVVNIILASQSIVTLMRSIALHLLLAS